MCNICKNTESKFSMTGLSGKMCTACHDAVLQARRGDLAFAKSYFANISAVSEEARQFVQNELSKCETISIKRATEATSKNQELSHPTASATPSIQSDRFTERSQPLTGEPDILRQISNDISTIKNILIFFLIVTAIGLGGTLLYIMQLVNAFKDLF